ncbi:MAG: hypothetical protein HY781_00310 [Chloroflexi bacterium]|nr:hypothetical protein [Chloroflexota bacterium]
MTTGGSGRWRNSDDSHGKHDVVLEIPRLAPIGVQVTELTYELIRNLSNQRTELLDRIQKQFREANVWSDTRVLVKYYISRVKTRKPNAKQLKRSTASIQEALRTLDRRVRKLEFDFGIVWIIPIEPEAKFYVPFEGNIGIDLDFDWLPESESRYFGAIDEIIKKKRNSKSSWLLIWSLQFLIDSNSFGDRVIEYMKTQFARTQFERVYFIESLDGEGLFQANLSLHRVK